MPGTVGGYKHLQSSVVSSPQGWRLLKAHQQPATAVKQSRGREPHGLEWGKDFQGALSGRILHLPSDGEVTALTNNFTARKISCC